MIILWIELSYLLSPDETVTFESIQKPDLQVRGRMTQGKYNNTSNIFTSCHAGTHIDTPFHISMDGITVDRFDISDFIFERPLLIEMAKSDMEIISKGDLLPYADKLGKSDLLMVYTGFSKYRKTDPERYLSKPPGLGVESAKYLTENFDLKGFAIDTPGIENVPEGRKTGFQTHKALMKPTRRFISIEDANLKPIVGKRIKRVFAIPLRVVGAEASPITLFAEVE